MTKEQLIEGINLLKKEKNALILGHYYLSDDLQDIVDVLGDSLVLARKAAETNAELLVVCGVHFMAETAVLLSPEKKVLIPDMYASCSLAESCDAKEFAAFVKAHPDHKVISYVNTTAAVKAVSDVCVTSSNARHIVDQFPKDQALIFGPDKNLGSYLNLVTGRNMLLWDGACHVHAQFSASKLAELKAEHPEAVVLAHPECPKDVLELSDVIGSTSALLKHAVESDDQLLLVATEPGIIHEMRKQMPSKTYVPVPSDECACNQCEYMRMHTLQKVYDCLLNESPQVTVEEEVAVAARQAITKMLEMS